jgi:VWFA-related protein
MDGAGGMLCLRSIGPMRFFQYVSAIALFSLSLLISAQQPPQPTSAAGQKGTYTLSSTVKLVVLDVVVTDKKGNVVSNLKKDDFQVFEDKRLQTISNFDAPEAHAVTPSMKIDSTEDLDRVAPDTPTSIIVLDEFSSRFEDMAFAHYSIKKYLDSQPSTLAQPTMLLAVDLNRFTVVKDYTQDRAAIITALDHHLGEYPWRHNSGSWRAEEFAAGFRSLMQVAEATAGHPGHKNMIWVGRGLPIVTLSRMNPGDQAKLTAEIQTCINMLLAARVTMYTVDPAGIYTPTATDEMGIDVNDPFGGGTLQFGIVAQATGGKAFHGRNDVDAEIGTSARDGSDFYTLSYVPNDASDAKRPFRGIRVVMKDPNLRASAREGYYLNAATDMSRPITDQSKRAVVDLNGAANNTLVYDGVPMTVVRGDAPGSVKVHVDGDTLPWVDHGSDTPRTVQLQVFCVPFDKKNKAMKQTALSFVARSPALKPGAPPQKVNINFPVTYEGDAQAVRLRVIVREPDSGKLGAANLDLQAK